MFIFGPPNIAKLKANGNIKGLIKALVFQKDWKVRRDAATAIGELGFNDAKDAIAARLTNDDDINVKYAAVAALDKLDWVAVQDSDSAWYWRLKWNLAKCAECGVHAIEPLLPVVIDGKRDAMGCYALLAQPALDTLIACTNTVFQHYNSFTSGVTSLNFSSDEDRRKSAIIKKLSERLENCAQTIGMFGNPLSEKYLIQLYSQVNNSIYSHADGGFSDMFNAMHVRMEIVSAFKYSCSSTGLQFLGEVLEKDRAILVKWEAADVVAFLADVSLNTVKNSRIESALHELVLNMQEKVESGQSSTSNNSRLPRYVTLLKRLKS